MNGGSEYKSPIKEVVGVWALDWVVCICKSYSQEVTYYPRSNSHGRGSLSKVSKAQMSKHQKYRGEKHDGIQVFPQVCPHIKGGIKEINHLCSKDLRRVVFSLV